MTRHAQSRIQQRTIPAFVIDLLERCGSTMRCGGAERLFFDKAARKRLRHYLGGHHGMRLIEPWLTVYAVIGDNGQFVTVARQCRRFRRL
jgi:hypothetical protein